MDRYKVAIVDDDELSLDNLVFGLQKFENFHLEGTARNGVSGKKLIAKVRPDLLFLDIEMPYLTGLDLLASLSNPPRVIITSAYEQYALKGYEFDITDYLLKPISFDRFLKAVNKVHHLMLQLESSEPTDFIFVRSDRQMYKVFFKDILFVEGLENYVQIYTETHKLLTRTTMKRISEMLPDGNFLQVHKSYIINTKKIDLIDGNSILIGTHSITVARNYRNEVFTRILKNTL